MRRAKSQRGLELMSGIKELIHNHPDIDIVQAVVPPEMWVKNGPNDEPVIVDCVLFKRDRHYSIIPVPTLGTLLHTSAAGLRPQIPVAPLRGVKDWEQKLFDMLYSANMVANGRYFFTSGRSYWRVKMLGLMYRWTFKRTAFYVTDEEACMNSLANDWSQLLMKRMEKSKPFFTWVNVSLDLCTT